MQLLTQSKRTLGLAATGVTILILCILSYVYRTRLRVLGQLLVDETGSKKAAVVCVVLALFVLFCVLAWLLFPVLVYLKLKDLSHRASQLDQTLRLWSRDRAQLNDPPAQPAENAPRDKVSTDR